MAQDTPEGPRKRLRVGHISERGGVNAVRVLLESHGHVVDEVDGRSDYGRDLNVDITESAEITGVVIGIQVKGDREFIKDYWWELPTSDKDRYYWAESGVAVVGILWDPGTGEMRWANLTEYARYRRAGGDPISHRVEGYESFSPDIVHFHKEQVLNEETLPRMMSTMRGYAQLHFSPRMLNILDVFSLDPERSFNGVLYCWVVAHTDGRALRLLRYALPTLSGDALAKAIELLSMLGNRIRWISDDISSEVLNSFRWSVQEVSYLVRETGAPCKLVSLLAADPELLQIVLAAIGLAVSQGDQNCAFLLWILYRHLPGWRPNADDAALIQYPELLNSPRVQAELDRKNDIDEFWDIPLGLRCGECGASFSD
jgi:Domain of unknown function (DUF4365)